MNSGSVGTEWAWGTLWSELKVCGYSRSLRDFVGSVGAMEVWGTLMGELRVCMCGGVWGIL